VNRIPSFITSALAAAVVGSAFITAPARACSQLERVIESSYPVPSETGVPTNAVLFMSGSLVDPANVRLATIEGEPVAITVSPVLPKGFDVTPATPLEPDQKYVLSGGEAPAPMGSLGYSSTSVEFTTGAGPVVARLPIAPPEITAATLLALSVVACWNSILCLESTRAPDTRLSIWTGYDVLQELSPGQLNGSYGGVGFSDEQCMQVQLRDFLGNRSPVTELCADDAIQLSIPNERNFELSCDDYRAGAYVTTPADEPPAEERDAGCSLPGVAPHRPGVSLSVAGTCLVALAMLCRRARRRRTAASAE
jgi:hypothetical protein